MSNVIPNGVVVSLIIYTEVRIWRIPLTKNSNAESVPIPWRLLSCWRRLPVKFKEWRNNNDPASRVVIFVERVKFTTKIYGQILPANCFKGSTDVVKCNDIVNASCKNVNKNISWFCNALHIIFNQKIIIKISKLTISSNIVLLFGRNISGKQKSCLLKIPRGACINLT